MRMHTATRLVLLLSIAACVGENTASTAPRGTPAGAGANVSTSLPLSGRCETRFDPPPFPLPPVHRQIDTGTCQLSHLGRTEFFAIQEIDFATGSQISIEVAFTAANGDVLRATNVGSSTASGPLVRFTGTMSFVGGTGRFEHAAGQARLQGTANLMTNTAAFTFADGWISNAPQDRSRQ
jgi:hypothetical protein